MPSARAGLRYLRSHRERDHGNEHRQGQHQRPADDSPASQLPRQRSALRVASVANATATLPQLAIARFLQSGGYDRHLRALRRRRYSRFIRMSFSQPWAPRIEAAVATLGSLTA